MGQAKGSRLQCLIQQSQYAQIIEVCRGLLKSVGGELAPDLRSSGLSGASSLPADFDGAYCPCECVS